LIRLNFSACYASKNNWEKSAEDAKTCVELDPEFIKGYYRLGVALTELKLYKEAYSILVVANKKDPGM